jgi:hypothetical protein
MDMKQSFILWEEHRSRVLRIFGPRREEVAERLEKTA